MLSDEVTKFQAKDDMGKCPHFHVATAVVSVAHKQTKTLTKSDFWINQ